MIADTQPTRDDAVRHAVRVATGIAGREGVVVYSKNDEFYVLRQSASKPKGSTLVCIAQRWDRSTVQVRYAGARSEYVTV